MEYDVDIQPFRDVLSRLEEALIKHADDPATAYVRDAVILRFDITMGTAISVLGRYLDSVYFLPNARVLSPRQLIRHAARLNIVSDCEAWLRHVENRNRVAHAYLESTAVAVADGAAAFATDARALLSAMEQGIADGG